MLRLLHPVGNSTDLVWFETTYNGLPLTIPDGRVPKITDLCVTTYVGSAIHIHIVVQQQYIWSILLSPHEKGSWKRTYIGGSNSSISFFCCQSGEVVGAVVSEQGFSRNIFFNNEISNWNELVPYGYDAAGSHQLINNRFQLKDDVTLSLSADGKLILNGNCQFSPHLSSVRLNTYTSLYVKNGEINTKLFLIDNTNLISCFLIEIKTLENNPASVLSMTADENFFSLLRSTLPTENQVYDLKEKTLSSFPLLRIAIAQINKGDSGLIFLMPDGTRCDSRGNSLPISQNEASGALLHCLDTYVANPRNPTLGMGGKFSYLPKSFEHFPLKGVELPHLASSSPMLQQGNFWFSMDKKYGLRQMDTEWHLFEIAAGISLFKETLGHPKSHSAAVISPVINDMVYCFIYHTKTQKHSDGTLRLALSFISFHMKSRITNTVRIWQVIPKPICTLGLFDSTSNRWKLIAAALTVEKENKTAIGVIGQYGLTGNSTSTTFGQRITSL